MTTLRTAAQQALEALNAPRDAQWQSKHTAAIAALKAALAEPTGKDSLQVEPTVAENATAEFDHSVGADRFRVVRGAFWWHVLIGDSTTEHGKFRTKASAEKMAADLLREFRNGAFVQHQGGGNLPPPLQEATVQQQLEDTPPSDYRRGYWDGFRIGKREGRIEAEDALAEPVQEPVAWRTFDGEGGYDYRTYEHNEDYAAEWAKRNPRHAGWVEPLYTAPPQRKPLTREEVDQIWNHEKAFPDIYAIARAIERAHGIVPSECPDSHQPGCDHCNSPLWCGTKCKACGRKA